MSDEREEPTPRAWKACAEWLSTCLRLGWSREMLDDLEALWWRYHDRRGNLITGPLPAEAQPVRSTPRKTDRVQQK